MYPYPELPSYQATHRIYEAVTGSAPLQAHHAWVYFTVYRWTDFTGLNTLAAYHYQLSLAARFRFPHPTLTSEDIRQGRRAFWFIGTGHGLELVGPSTTPETL